MVIIGLTLMAALVAGPITISTHYLGIHFMVLGAMLALIGTNVISMGVLAKMILNIGSGDRTGLLYRLLLHPHLLEWTLVLGGLAALAGLATDAAILFRWLRSNAGAMEDTVHLAIAASTIVVFGVELVFSAFLIFLVRARIIAQEDRSGIDA